MTGNACARATHRVDDATFNGIAHALLEIQKTALLNCPLGSRPKTDSSASLDRPGLTFAHDRATHHFPLSPGPTLASTQIRYRLSPRLRRCCKARPVRNDVRARLSGEFQLAGGTPAPRDDRALGRGSPPCPHGRSDKAPRSRPRRHRLLPAQSLHPAAPALPRPLPLLHLRART